MGFPAQDWHFQIKVRERKRERERERERKREKEREREKERKRDLTIDVVKYLPNNYTKPWTIHLNAACTTF
jgi:hypothetical protein